MTNFQFISLLVAVLGGQLGTIYYLSSRIDRVDSELKFFYRDLGKHDGRLDAIEKRIG